MQQSLQHHSTFLLMLQELSWPTWYVGRSKTASLSHYSLLACSDHNTEDLLPDSVEVEASWYHSNDKVAVLSVAVHAATDASLQTSIAPVWHDHNGNAS